MDTKGDSNLKTNVNISNLSNIKNSTIIGNQCPQELIDIFIKIANLLESINTLLYSK